MNAEEQTPIDHSQLDPIIRLELLVGHLSDLLSPARELISQLQLRANASSQRRSDLALLRELTGNIWRQLDVIRDEIKELRAKGME